MEAFVARRVSARQRVVTLLVLGPLLWSALPVQPAAWEAGQRPPSAPLATSEPGPVGPLLTTLLQLLGIGSNPTPPPGGDMRSGGAPDSVDKGAHLLAHRFGFHDHGLQAQVTGTLPTGTATPEPPPGTTPPPAGTSTPPATTPVTGTPPGTVLPRATPGAGVVPVHPSRGYLVPGQVSPVDLPGTYRLQTARRVPSVAAVAAQCTPNVQVTAELNAQQNLQVTIRAQGAGNLVRSVYFPRQSAQNPGDRFTNAFVSFTDQAVSVEILDVTYVLNPPVEVLTLWLSAVAPGQPTHVPLVVTDSCGQWPTFVGAGTSVPLACLRVEAVPAGTQHNPPYVHEGTVGGVHTGTGSFGTSQADAGLTGLGPVPQLARSYNSNDPRPSPLGQGWRHNYAMHLARPPDGSPDLILVGPQGRSDRYGYSPGPPAAYAPPPGGFTTLTWNSATNTYTATHLDQSTWTFDACGRLTALKDPYGNQATLSYDAAGRLTAVRDPAGRGGSAGALRLGYDPATGRLVTVTDLLNRVVTYGYDAQGRLRTVTDRAGKVTTFSYDGTTHRLRTITDARRPPESPECPDGGCVVLTNTYDANGRVRAQADALGQETIFVYRGDGADVTFPPTSFQPTAPPPFRPTRADTYDGNGWLVTQVTSPAPGETYTVR